MARLIATRAIFAIPVLFLISAISFGMLRAAPGDHAVLQAGAGASEEAIEATRERLGLNDSIIEQYFRWLGQVLRGDLGTSYTSGLPVTELIGARLPATIQLSVFALALIIGIGVPLGVTSALRRNRPYDQVVRVLSLIGISVPNFVVGVLLILVFGWWMTGVLPFQGFVSLSDDAWESVRHSLLPAIALAIPEIGLVARLTRSSMLEVLSQEYISSARALGIAERTVIWKDALRNALMPVVTIVGVITGFLLGGSVVVENVFGIPGVGRLLIESFATRDYPVTIGVMMFIAAVFVITNLVVDVLYGVINPRIRLAQRRGGK
ncbi:MAG: glutathione ABC transporter permease GsiC [Actinobacteria bacterium]|nr:MAG: glutathione ABC transporter permease GsiC [Actinomycetota bacterium]